MSGVLNKLRGRSQSYNPISINGPDTNPITKGGGLWRSYSTFNSLPEFQAVPTTTPDLLEIYNTDHTFPIQLKTTSAVGDETGIKRCSNCKKMYKKDENTDTACKYHRGRYGSDGSISVSTTSSKFWSCCKAEPESAEGCCKGSHEEDVRTTHILAQFTTSAESEVNQEDAGVSDEDIKVEKKGVDIKEEPKKKHRIFQTPYGRAFKHEISKTDTLQGIALKYDVKVEDIKRMNKLTNNNISVHKFLNIPAK